MDAIEDTQFLELALQQARLAAENGEVPVGAVIVKDGQVIAAACNSPIAAHDPSAHAEINALRQAAQKLKNYRLEGCTMYVTLEPCAMCVGALLHARLARVVYAAAEPKTGACGSVVNLFDSPLNHQTEVQYATDLGASCAELARQSRQLLQNFFQKKRRNQTVQHATRHPLREDALRTPESCFDKLPGYAFAPNYLSDLPTLNGLRMHYVDEGSKDAALTYLCLHGNPAWSYLYRKMIPVFAQSGARVIAPDMIGFGKSDKPKKESFHSFTWHRQCLFEFIEYMNLTHVVLVVQDWGGILGMTLPMQAPQRYCGLLVMNTTLACGDQPLTQGFKSWRQMCQAKPDFDIAKLFARGNPHMSAQECAAYMAPFPDAGHRAATRAFPLMVPEHADDEGAALSRQAREFWRTQWQGQSLMAMGMRDPVFGQSNMETLRGYIAGSPPPMQISQAGHFVQEHGVEIAQAACHYFSPATSGHRS